jgi:hypothetical protein
VTVRALTVVGVVAVVVLAPAAIAKDFEPGDLRVCNAERCVAITNRPALAALGAFYYGGACPAAATRDGDCMPNERTPPRAAAAVRLGTPAFELRFRNGYVTGIVATARFDRFLSYGVNLGWFRRGRWYRVPPAAAAELRRLTAGLEPLRVTRAVIARSR